MLFGLNFCKGQDFEGRGAEILEVIKGAKFYFVNQPKLQLSPNIYRIFFGPNLWGGGGGEGGVVRSTYGIGISLSLFLSQYGFLLVF